MFTVLKVYGRPDHLTIWSIRSVCYSKSSPRVIRPPGMEGKPRSESFCPWFNFSLDDTVHAAAEALQVILNSFPLRDGICGVCRTACTNNKLPKTGREEGWSQNTAIWRKKDGGVRIQDEREFFKRCWFSFLMNNYLINSKSNYIYWIANVNVLNYITSFELLCFH